MGGLACWDFNGHSRKNKTRRQKVPQYIAGPIIPSDTSGIGCGVPQSEELFMNVK